MSTAYTGIRLRQIAFLLVGLKILKSAPPGADVRSWRY